VIFVEKVFFSLSLTKHSKTDLYLMNGSHFIKGSIAYTRSTFVASFESIWKCTRIAVKVHYW